MLRFGLRSVIDRAAPRGSAEEMKLLIRFPGKGLLDPSTGKWHFSSEYNFTGQIGVAAHREFQFHEEWEVMPGECTFKFRQGGRMIGSQQFLRLW